MRCFPVLLPATLLPGQWTADKQLHAVDNKVGFEVLTAVTTKSAIFWDIAPLLLASWRWLFIFIYRI
jgi:hypothetical protein